MTTSHDLAWAAGFVDGEGSFVAKAGTKTRAGVYRRYLRVSVAQKNRELLDKFQTIFGYGGIYRDAKRETHSFQAGGRDAFEIAAALWPWLGEKKKRDFKRALRAIAESRVAAAAALLPVPRECAADDCETLFTPDVRHPDTAYCSHRCHDRIFARQQRGPAAERYCKGCRCHADQRTRGCRRCMTRHWQRKSTATAKGVV